MATLLANERPQKRTDLEFVEPSQPNGRWTIHNPGNGRYLRLGKGAVDVLSTLDGTLTVDEIRHGTHVMPAEAVDSLLASFDSMELLVSDTAPKRRAEPPRFKFIPPFVFQFTVVRHPTWLGPKSVMARIAGHRVTVPLALTIAVAGLAGLVLQAGSVMTTLQSPVQFGWIALVPVILVVLNALHEFAHGAALGAQGGTPRRIGLMLFYLMPAMFCDVTDAWRIRDVHSRTAVLLAGPLLHATAGGVFALAALFTTGEAQLVLLITAIASYGFVFSNLIPFIRLDGYLALVSWLDMPNLREKSLTDLRRSLAWLFFGGSRPSRQLSAGWMLFALAATAFPAYLVVRFANIVRLVFLPFGVIGAVCLTVVWVLIGYFLSRGIGRLFQEARRPSGLRTGLTLALVVTAMISALLFVRVTPTTTGSVVGVSDGQISVAFQHQPWARTPEIGTVGVAYQAGLARGPDLAQVSVVSAVEMVEVPIDIFLPLRGFDTPAPADRVLTAVTDGANSVNEIAAQATAVDFDLASESLGETLYDFFVGSTIRGYQDCGIFTCTPDLSSAD